jgi:hypothetical protein
MISRENEFSVAVALTTLMSAVFFDRRRRPCPWFRVSSTEEMLWTNPPRLPLPGRMSRNPDRHKRRREWLPGQHPPRTRSQRVFGSWLFVDQGGYRPSRCLDAGGTAGSRNTSQWNRYSGPPVREIRRQRCIGTVRSVAPRDSGVKITV